MTDPIADMLARIRNALMVEKPALSSPYSKMKHQLAEILVKEGYIAEVSQSTVGGHPELNIVLKYVNKKPAIQMLKRVSTPGRRVYVGANKLPHVYDNLGIAIISTSRGLMTNNQARSEKIGGELICEIF